MTKSRFEKLEGERPESSPSEVEGRLDARFGAEPEMGNRATEHDSAQQHARFDADGGDGLGLDRDPLATLPMMQCPACQHDCGKFETACSRCGASLTDEAARAHNLKRAETLKAERALALAAEREKRAEEIAELELGRMKTKLAQEGMAQDLHDKFSGTDGVKGPAWPWVAGAAICFITAKAVPWFWLKVLLVAAGTVCLLTRLPKSAWEALAKPARRRW